MSVFHLFIYGLIQGVAEFLPISSSAHLALLPYLLQIQDPGVAFDLMMHIGTALAVIIYFRSDLLVYLRSLKELPNYKQGLSKDASFTLHIIIATISTVILAVLIKDLGATFGRKPFLIIINLIFFGLFMWIGDKKKDHSEQVLSGKLDLKKSVLIGLAQGMAIFPGVSRSGATMGTARFLGLGRDEASRFSFLLSLPVILMGAVAHIPELMHGQHQFILMDCLLGVFFSFVFGFATIYTFMKLIKKIGLGVFTIYRFILGLVLAYYFFY